MQITSQYIRCVGVLRVDCCVWRSGLDPISKKIALIAYTTAKLDHEDGEELDGKREGTVTVRFTGVICGNSSVGNDLLSFDLKS